MDDPRRRRDIREVLEEMYYQGPLAAAREWEKNGSAYVLHKALMLMKLQPFGLNVEVDIERLADGDLKKAIEVGAEFTWGSMISILHGLVRDSLLRQMWESHIKFLPKDPLGDTWRSTVLGKEYWMDADPNGKFGQIVTAHWDVPSVDDGKPITIHCCQYEASITVDVIERLLRQLICHEVDEQLLVDGIRVFDPHKIERMMYGGQ